MLAIADGAPRIYNLADDDGTVSLARARRHLGWDVIKG